MHDEVAIASGRSFMLTDGGGDIEPATRHGLFLGDTRFLSCLRVSLDETPLVPIGGGQCRSNCARFFATNPDLPGAVAGTLILERSRRLDGRLTERIRLTNHGHARARVCLRVDLGADFADVFEMRSLPEWKLGPMDVPPPAGCHQAFAYQDRGFPCRTLVRWSRKGRQAPGVSEFEIKLAPGESWSCRMCVELLRAEEQQSQQLPGSAIAQDVQVEWQPADPATHQQQPAGEQVSAALPLIRARAESDLETLRFQLATGERIVGAGLPYFMTLFGRDSIMTAYLVLRDEPALAGQVLLALAEYQGRQDDPQSEEQPGKIPHEVRDGEIAQRRCERYYGSVDATPLFLVLLSEYVVVTGDFRLCERLWPAAEAALAWIDCYGDSDGDGFIEYERRNPDGLENQGWKDSWDAVCFARGRLAKPPIALCEAQGFVYDAKTRMADLYQARGNARRATQLRAQAWKLRERFEQAFWMENEGTYALALDAHKQPVNSVASNAALCLWSGIASPEHAAMVAARLSRPDCFSGWGLRTLSTTMAGYNPIGYHTGSVWPHDTVFAAEGFLRYNMATPARRMLQGLMSAALRMPNHRLPELFAGYSQRQFPDPVAYPDANAPQAWAAAATVRACALLRELEAAPIGRTTTARARDLDATVVHPAATAPVIAPRLPVRSAVVRLERPVQSVFGPSRVPHRHNVRSRVPSGA